MRRTSRMFSNASSALRERGETERIKPGALAGALQLGAMGCIAALRVDRRQGLTDRLPVNDDPFAAGELTRFSPPNSTRRIRVIQPVPASRACPPSLVRAQRANYAQA